MTFENELHFWCVEMSQNGLTGFIYLFSFSRFQLSRKGKTWRDSFLVERGYVLLIDLLGVTCSRSRNCLPVTSDSSNLVVSKTLCVFLSCQEASTQESWWEGNGPGGELPAKIPTGEGLVPEGRVPDFLPAAGTGSWPAGAKQERLFKFEESVAYAGGSFAVWFTISCV